MRTVIAVQISGGKWHSLWHNRAARAGLVVVLIVGAVLTGRLAMIDTGPGGPGILGIEMVGKPAAALRWVQLYGVDQVDRALAFDVLFILCWATLLALVAIWTAPAFRTESTRRLGLPIACIALGAGVLDLLENLFILLGTGPWGLDPWMAGWRLAATASWGKWLAVAVVVAYAVGGLASLLLPRAVRDVLTADSTVDQPDGLRPRWTEERSQLGLAFSGGGIRAASISLGALQTLERGARMGWADANHVTSVSGGSYMAGAWSLARTDPAPLSAPHPPAPWARGAAMHGPEERHLRANLGYLLSNSPRGEPDIGMGDDASTTSAKASQRMPAVVATVLTGIAVNALVFLGVLWLLAQLLGRFYRWYGGLTCPTWRLDRPLTFTADQACMVAPDRAAWPILGWLILGLAGVLIWVLLPKLTNLRAAPVPSVWLLVPKYLGYGGLAVGAALAVVLIGLPLLIQLLWRPVAAHDLFTSLVTVAGAIGSSAAVLRLLRKPLARLAPTIGGVIFALLLLFLLCRWALGAAIVAPSDRNVALVVIVTVILLALHFGGTVEFWSLAAFYRGKIRAAFATYRDETGVRVRAYTNGNQTVAPQRVEPSMTELTARGPASPRGVGTPLTVCASATVTGRSIRTHYGIPSLSVTFSPTAMRLFVPMEEDGLWQVHECPTAALETLRPRGLPRVTTMMTVGLSGAAVSPAMGRFRIGPISMLLAFFNVRLGAWVPNPRYAGRLATELAGRGKRLPRPGLGYLLKEFVGFHDPSDLYLYVTDGGHWENSGLVELLRTSHHDEVVCVDADSGPGNVAKSIARAIDLAQLECAARVVLNLDVLRASPDPTPGRDYSPRSVNLGLVFRTDAGPWRLSLLWYSKPALTQDMPPQLLAYREVDPTFPRVSTLDQFFHAAQFAAYRDLGRYNARKILTARTLLRECVGQHATYEAFRTAVSSTPEDGPTEPWVLPELVSLIDQLAIDRVVEERAAFADELYAAVRSILAAE